MSQRQQRDRDTGERTGGVSIARAVKIAFLVFGLLLGILAVAALMTDGTPHAPFEYGVGE